jgi:hypothetical protein
MRRFPSFVTFAVAVAGCASAQKPVAPLATASAPPPAMEKSSVPPPDHPIAAETPPGPAVSAVTGTSVSYGIPRKEEWDDLDVGAMPRMRRWTPDAVIGNRVTQAKIAFASVPAVLGTTAQVAEGIRAQMNAKKEQADVVMEDVTGRRAGFTFENAKDGSRGKVVVTRVPGLDSQYVLLVGEWPADADSTSLADIDNIAKTIRASSAP